jgi:transposase InsO family protein
MSRALEDWAYQRGVQLDFIRPGKPVENTFIESFNSTFPIWLPRIGQILHPLALDRMFLSPEPHLLTPATAT